MKLLYAPWRSNYITSTSDDKKTEDQCVFCVQFKEQNDAKNFIIKRFTHCVAMLNLYPYNAGHLLIVPYAHKATLQELEPAERADLIEIVSLSNELLLKALKCQGINIGLNLGKAAGGSIPDHLHIHIVPRWLGDTNFLVAVADTKQISFNLHTLYNNLKEAFERSVV